jgi:hypothetical protein
MRGESLAMLLVASLACTSSPPPEQQRAAKSDVPASVPERPPPPTPSRLDPLTAIILSEVRVLPIAARDKRWTFAYEPRSLFVEAQIKLNATLPRTALNYRIVCRVGGRNVAGSGSMGWTTRDSLQWHEGGEAFELSGLSYRRKGFRPSACDVDFSLEAYDDTGFDAHLGHYCWHEGDQAASQGACDFVAANIPSVPLLVEKPRVSLEKQSGRDASGYRLAVNYWVRAGQALDRPKTYVELRCVCQVGSMRWLSLDDIGHGGGSHHLSPGDSVSQQTDCFVKELSSGWALLRKQPKWCELEFSNHVEADPQFFCWRGGEPKAGRCPEAMPSTTAEQGPATVDIQDVYLYTQKPPSYLPKPTHEGWEYHLRYTLSLDGRVAEGAELVHELSCDDSIDSYPESPLDLELLRAGESVALRGAMEHTGSKTAECTATFRIKGNAAFPSGVNQTYCWAGKPSGAMWRSSPCEA